MLAGFTPDTPDSYLDIFDVPVRGFLESQIRELRYDPLELRPAIDVAITEGKKSVYEESLFYLPPSLQLARIQESAYSFILGVLSQSKKWDSAYERIRSYSSIFLTGAGISFESGMPLSRILTDVLKFCTAKDCDELRREKKKCLKFKLELKRISDGKQPGTSHELIAQNFSQCILEIICLNWDNLLERAAQKLGKKINKVNEDRRTTDQRHLWKFHGDVENIKSDNMRGKGGWVFPDEEGYVFKSFVRYVDETGLKGQLLAFIILGYSENEKQIYDNVISVFEKAPPRPTFRVGLDLSKLHEEYYIVGPSDFILKKILPSSFA